MSEVKRYDLVGDMDGNCNLNEARMEIYADGIYVKHKDYAGLEVKCAALAAENAAMKLFIRGSCYVFDGEQDEISDAYICATDGGMPQTPATDAFLAEIERKAIHKFINSIEHILRDKLSPYDTEEMLEVMRIFLEEHGGEQK